jgi:hypothetical protein
MVPELSKLTTSERELVYKAPLLVCILIAGADGKIDGRELTEAINIARDRHWVKSNLASYFHEVAQDFEDKIKMLIQSYPYETAQRNETITNELSELNLLWLKLGADFSSSFYEALKYMAQRIASSSGAFWGKISAEEARLLDLPMIADPSK